MKSIAELLNLRYQYETFMLSLEIPERYESIVSLWNTTKTVSWWKASFEVNATDTVFTNPEHKLTENYITGRFG